MSSKKDKLSTTGNQHEGNPCFILGSSQQSRSLTLDFGANHQGHTVKIIATLSKSAQDENQKHYNLTKRCCCYTICC